MEFVGLHCLHSFAIYYLGLPWANSLSDSLPVKSRKEFYLLTSPSSSYNTLPLGYYVLATPASLQNLKHLTLFPVTLYKD